MYLPNRIQIYVQKTYVFSRNSPKLLRTQLSFSRKMNKQMIIFLHNGVVGVGLVAKL